MKPNKKAESMIKDAISIFGFSEANAIRASIYAIRIMILHTPLSITPSKREKKFHKYWERVNVKLCYNLIELTK